MKRMGNHILVWMQLPWFWRRRSLKVPDHPASTSPRTYTVLGSSFNVLSHNFLALLPVFFLSDDVKVFPKFKNTYKSKVWFGSGNRKLTKLEGMTMVKGNICSQDMLWDASVVPQPRPSIPTFCLEDLEGRRQLRDTAHLLPRDDGHYLPSYKTVPRLQRRSFLSASR